MRHLLLALFVFSTCTGFAWLNSFLHKPVSETKVEVVEEVVVEHREEIAPTIEQTSDIQWLHNQLIINRSHIRSINFENIMVGSNVADDNGDGWVLKNNDEFASETEMYARANAELWSYAKRASYLMPAEKSLDGYKVIFKINVGPSHEQFHFFRVSYDLNGFSDNHIALFTDTTMTINPRFITPERSMSLATWWDRGGAERHELYFTMTIPVEDKVIYYDFVNQYEDWK